MKLRNITLLTMLLLLATSVQQTSLLHGMKRKHTAPSSEQPTKKRKKDLPSWLSDFQLPTYHEAIPHDNVDSIDFASEHFGNKVANSCVMHVLCDLLNSKHLLDRRSRVEVPAFDAISHYDMTAFVKQGFPDFDALWQEFVQAQDGLRKLTERGAEVLATIREGITRRFEQDIPEAIQTTIKTFLNRIGHKGLLMVRSTGLEDRKDIANAGGNESVTSVQPTVDAVWPAMQEVVVSYFSEQSFKQRIEQNDPTILDQPRMPILLQVMVGEKPWEGKHRTLNEIPVSGVIYSREAIGSTPGIVQIEVAYGHMR